MIWIRIFVLGESGFGSKFDDWGRCFLFWGEDVGANLGI